MEKLSIIQYLIKRLNELGVTEVFGVPGDFNFNIIEEVGFNPNTKWIGCCNELNAGYAADGYARIKGMGAVVTTFGVGELSAINAIAGSFAEEVPVVKLVGLPKKTAFDAGRILHHSLRASDDKVFCEMYSNVTEYSVILSEENAQEEIEQALSAAYNTKRPVYIGLYDDLCLKPINITREAFTKAESDKDVLNSAIEHICTILDKSKNPLIISEYPVLRYGLESQMQEFIDKTGFMATTMVMGKGSIDENSKNFIGLYCGTLTSPETTKVAESADCVIGFGVLMSDFNSGGFSANLNPADFIDIQASFVKINGAEYQNVYIYDILAELNKRNFAKKDTVPSISFGYEKEDATDELLTQNFIYSTMQDFLDPSDIYVAETALTSFGSVDAKLPYGTKVCTQSLWGSIGWGTPACFGAAIADRNKRVVFLTGEGSHQMTAQEVSSMMRFGVNPIIVVVNNEGYTIERLLCEDPLDAYNDIPKWYYTKLVEAFDGKVVTCQARTKKEFLDALNNARRTNEMVYMEVFTEMMDAPDFACKLSEKCAPIKK